MADGSLMAETRTQRIQRLQREAKTLATGQVAELQTMMADLAAFAMEIAKGGDAYHAGIRECAWRLADELDSRAQTIEAIRSRTS